MCGRFSLTADDLAILAKHFGIKQDSIPLTPRYNVAPSQRIITLTNFHDQKKFIPMTWGLPLPGRSHKRHLPPLINIRSESLIDKPLFKKYLDGQRCLIPADGFYEWKKIGSKKIPYRAILKNEPVFAFAGVWDFIQNKDGTKNYYAAILTTEANSLLASIHSRMPVILTHTEEEAWLNVSTQSMDQLYPLLDPYPSSLMKLYEVSSHVNSWKNEDPECIQPINRA